MGVITGSCTALIASGQTVSSVIFVGAKLPVALVMPAAFTGTAMTFEGSADGVTYQAINSGGSAYSETVAQGKNISLDKSVFEGFPYIKLVSGSAEGADRAVVVMTRRFVES